MSRPRFTIAGVIAVVALTAVGLAALRAADDAWDGGLFGLTAFTLLTAVLLAVHRRGGRRAYWLGFALFGWAYLVASLVPPVEARLPTSKGLAAAWRLMPGSAILWDDDLMLDGVRSFDIGSTATSPDNKHEPPEPLGGEGPRLPRHAELRLHQAGRGPIGRDRRELPPHRAFAPGCRLRPYGRMAVSEAARRQRADE